jgi:chemotaxis response regulator CheB
MRGILQSVFRKYAEEQLPGQVPMELCGAAHDGMDGLAAVTRLRPDVVILDLEMPRMNGLDVLERLRFDEPGLPVILCSSYTEHGARATLDALALGASDCCRRLSPWLRATRPPLVQSAVPSALPPPDPPKPESFRAGALKSL